MQARDGPPEAPSQAVLYPAITHDYYIGKGNLGFGLFANRKMKKGKMMFDDSLEYNFSDVEDGDMLLLDRNRKASQVSGVDIPQYFSLSRETLLTTHGVPCLCPDPEDPESAGIIRWRLEVPGMLINHSCDPNVVDFPPRNDVGEAYASRKVKRNEELTFDYCLQYYDHGPFFSKCDCGGKNCRGTMMGFKGLSDEEKERLFPAATKAVQAMYLADIGKGPPVKSEQPTFPPRNSSLSPDVMRLVCPPPSSALAKVEVKQSPNGTFSLCATQDVSTSGEVYYEAWNQTWPDASKEFDMVFGSPILGTHDPPEGTVVRICAPDIAYKNKHGNYLFSGWQLLTQHSCEPNIVYDFDDEESYGSQDEGYWVGVYASKDIKAGDELTVDYNCLVWDHTESNKNLNSCKCGAENCTGTVCGFKYLLPELKEERKALSWLRTATPHDVNDKMCPGEALSRHVRAMWRQDPEHGSTAPPESDSDDSSSSSDDD